jgi:hypothetical protein
VLFSEGIERQVGGASFEVGWHAKPGAQSVAETHAVVQAGAAECRSQRKGVQERSGEHGRSDSTAHVVDLS